MSICGCMLREFVQVERICGCRERVCMRWPHLGIKTLNMKEFLHDERTCGCRERTWFEVVTLRTQ